MRTSQPWRWIAASLLMVSSGCGAMLPAPEVEGDYEIVRYDRYGACPDGQLSLHKLDREATVYGDTCTLEIQPDFITCEKELEVDAVPLEPG